MEPGQSQARAKLLCLGLRRSVCNHRKVQTTGTHEVFVLLLVTPGGCLVGGGNGPNTPNQLSLG